MHLQHNKVTNLRLAASRMDGLVIAPGETFSFNRVVGNCTRRKGYVDGMKLSNGAAEAGVGGGHLPARQPRPLDGAALPADGRRALGALVRPVPRQRAGCCRGAWAARSSTTTSTWWCATTPTTPFQLRTWLGERYLHGQLRTDVRPEHTWRVEARGEQFLRREGQVYRRNQIWRRVIDRRTGDQVGEELVKTNCALVVYEPGPDVEVIDLD